MPSTIEFANFVDYAGADVLRVVFVLTIVGLAFIVRRPAKNNRKQEEK
jgi:hypothetical protein